MVVLSFLPAMFCKGRIHTCCEERSRRCACRIFSLYINTFTGLNASRRRAELVEVSACPGGQKHYPKPKDSRPIRRMTSRVSFSLPRSLGSGRVLRSYSLPTTGVETSARPLRAWGWRIAKELTVAGKTKLKAADVHMRFLVLHHGIKSPRGSKECDGTILGRR